MSEPISRQDPVSFVLAQEVGRFRQRDGSPLPIWPQWAIEALNELVYHRGGEWPGSVTMLDALAAAAERQGLT